VKKFISALSKMLTWKITSYIFDCK